MRRCLTYRSGVQQEVWAGDGNLDAAGRDEIKSLLGRVGRQGPYRQRTERGPRALQSHQCLGIEEVGGKQQRRPVRRATEIRRKLDEFGV